MRVERSLMIGVLVLSGADSSCLRAADEPGIEPEALAVMEQLNATYETARSYSDVMTLNTTGTEGLLPANAVDHFNFRAQVAWQKPNKARIVKHADSGEFRAVSDGETLWAVSPHHRGYYLRRPAKPSSITEAFDEVGANALGLFHILQPKRVDLLAYEGLVLKMGADNTVSAVPVRVVVARFPVGDGINATLTLSIGAKDGLLRRATMERTSERGRMTLVETHTNIRLNPELPDSMFTFSPPQDARPIDYFAELEPQPVASSDAASPDGLREPQK